jgi:hypothetical protein
LLRIAAVALALWHFGFRVLTSIRSKRTPNIYLFFEFAFGVPANITL